MKLCSYSANGTAGYGIVSGTGIIALGERYPLCGRHPLGKGFFDQILILVGCARVYGLFMWHEHHWPSCSPPDQLPIDSTRSKRQGVNGFHRSAVFDR